MARPSASASPLRSGLLEEHSLIQRVLGSVIDLVSRDDGAPGDLALATWRVFATAAFAQVDAEDALLLSVLPQERNARLLAHEHRYIRSRLAELGESAERRELRPRPLVDLRDILQAHARNDDRLLYVWAESELGEPHRTAALDALATRLDTLSERQRELFEAASDSTTAKNSSTFTGLVK